MADRLRLRHSLRRYHIWLGWLIGVPMLFWTLSGVVMVWKPIEEVRGTALLADPAPFELATAPIAPRVEGRGLKSLTIEPRAPGPRWVLRFADGGSRLADPASGQLLPGYSAADAAREVTARYKGTAKVASVTRTDPDKPPLDLRKPIATWQVAMSDGTHFYVDAANGEVVARRTRFWRFYDWMWGLHIMDLQTREDTHNPWIIVFGVATLMTTFLALVLLPLTIKRRNKP
ncbi:MAG TPA: PepSY domain-containing protein [Sphingomicrobium sp.]|nr:PepSY domain-containing protein [Sphingomicrobium sp.]